MFKLGLIIAALVIKLHFVIMQTIKLVLVKSLNKLYLLLC